MTGLLPLGESIEAVCPCCHLKTMVRLREVTDSPACLKCKSHGTDAEKRDQTHFILWSEYSAKGDEKRKEQIAALRREVEFLQGVNHELREQIESDYLADALPDSLVGLLRNDLLLDAEEQRDRAKDREAEVLSILILDIEPHHRGKKGPTSKCRCGQLTSECGEWNSIEPLRSQLRVWEEKQLANARVGKPHRLPRRHPEVARLTRKFEFRGLPDSFAVLENPPRSRANWTAPATRP